MTLEEFIELYDTTEVPILPDNWRDELYDDMFQVGQYEPRGKEKENPEKGVVTPSDIMKVWKMLQAQDWFIDAFNRRDVEKDHGIAEDKWGITRDLVVWWTIKTGKNSVTSNKELSTDAAKVLFNLSFRCAVYQLDGISMKDIFEEPEAKHIHAGMVALFKFYKVAGYEND